MAANLPGDLSAVGASDVERIIEPASAVTAKKKQKKKKPKKKATVGTEAEASLEISEAINASAALEKLKLDQTNISDSLITNGGPRNGNGNGNGKPTFWDTQPVPKDYDSSLPDGPIRPRPKLGPDELPPAEKLLDGFEWATLDLREPVQVIPPLNALAGRSNEVDTSIAFLPDIAPTISLRLRSALDLPSALYFSLPSLGVIRSILHCVDPSSIIVSSLHQFHFHLV